MKKYLLLFLLSFVIPQGLQVIFAQEQKTDSIWSLQKCISYALEHNISVQKLALTSETNKVNVEQAKAGRNPSLNASVGQTFSWSRPLNNELKYDKYSGYNNTDVAINSNVTLYSGNKINNTIKQSDLTFQAGEYDTETQKESISLNILSAYLQVLYDEEEIKNSKQQIESLSQQLTLAEARMKLGAISRSDYLQVKSELASEKQTLAVNEGQLSTDKVSLMQLMEFPVTSTFEIIHPDFTAGIIQQRIVDAKSLYDTALVIKPQIKSAELNQKVAEIGVDIAKASQYPTLSLSGSLGSGYANSIPLSYGYQMGNKISPSLGLTLSIPISQNKEISSKIQTAKIQTKQAELNTENTKNALRKSIEQACVDVTSAEKKYEAGNESYNAALESAQVAAEKYAQSLINSTDYLVQKTNLIKAENQLLQYKYNLIFSYKTLDFYLGKSLAL
jgi:outer membrane protein